MYKAKYLLYIIAIFICFLIQNTAWSEQVFSISEINTVDFPKVRASFVALNASGNSYKNLSKNDFVVFDNGIDVTPSMKVECVDSLVNPAVSILLVLDKSTSMLYQYPNGETRWSWVKLGATSFINTIEMTQGTTIAMTSFAKLAGLTCPFTNNKKELLDSLENIKVGGGTEYDPPFLDWRYGAVEMFLKGSPDLKKRRIVVFLTDGEPNHDPSVDSIKTELIKANIQVYSITLAMPMNKYLSEISISTGGGAYAVYTKDELNDIYRYIALDIQRKQFCSISWDSPFGCSDVSRYRTAKISFLIQNTTVERQFITPPNSIATVDMSEPFLEFGDPAPNNSIDLDLTITARNSDFNIISATINPNTFFSIIDWDANGSAPDPPFTIKKDESRTIKVRFTQGSQRLYRTATLLFEGSPCPQMIQLIGGVTQIRIVTPNKGETFSTCDTVAIRWTGVEPTKPVNLSFSSNNGTNWNPLANNITGLEYKWKPPAPGNQYLVRGTVAPVSVYMWALSGGGVSNDIGASIAVTKDNMYFYVTGSFEGTAQFGTKIINSRGTKDIFIAKYDRDGTIQWVETAGGPGYDSSLAVCVDNAGNAYITGVVFSNASFGNITPNMAVDGKAYCFVAKYAPDGGTPSIALIGPNVTYPTFSAGGTKIRFRDADNELDIQGNYINSVVSPFGYSLPKVTVVTKFTAIMKSDLSYGPVSKGGTDYPDYSSTISFDSDGNKYTCGSFLNNIAFGSTTLISKGQQDVFVHKFGGTPGSEDICDTVFAVEAPKLSFKINNVLYPNTTLGSVRDTLLDAQLCNIGSLPITISGYRFIGTNPTDFVLTSNIVSLTIKPGECLPLEIGFQPTDVGQRSAQLIISGSCAQDIFMNLAGSGVCSGVSEALVEFKGVNVGGQKQITINCLFKNTNPKQVLVTPKISGPNASDFSIDESGKFVPGDSCLTLPITFSPLGPGPRVAFIEFQLPQGCENPVTELRGDGVETALIVNPVHYGDRRIMTQNDSVLKIQNTSILPARLDSIKFETKPGNEFAMINLPALPYSIPSNSTLDVDLRFIPQAETNYSYNIMAYAQGNATPVYAEVTGKGVVPKFNAIWICDTAVAPGKSSIAKLVIENLSSSMDLTIYSLDFKYVNTEFAWENGKPANNLIIPKNNNQTFNIIFTPNGTGRRANLIAIKHDGEIGPSVAPVVDTTVDAECDGLGLTADNNIDFGGVLICDELISKLTITNESSQQGIITNATISGNDAQYFEIAYKPGQVIDPYSFIELDVKFKPIDVRAHDAVLKLNTNIGYDLIVNLTGSGEYLYYTATASEYKNEPGYPIRIPIKLRVNKLAKGTVPALKVQIAYHYDMLKYERTMFKNIANWTWDAPKLIQKGLLEISGSGNLATPFDGSVFDVQWTLFLTDTSRSKINFKPIIGLCQTRDTSITDIAYSPFCFMAGRLVVTGSTNYYLMTPEPNPANDNTTLKFGLGLDGFTEIDIYNYLGEKVRTYAAGDMKSGQYEINLPTYELSDGQYMIILRSGHESKVQKLIINR